MRMIGFSVFIAIHFIDINSLLTMSILKSHRNKSDSIEKAKSCDQKSTNNYIV